MTPEGVGPTRFGVPLESSRIWGGGGSPNPMFRVWEPGLGVDQPAQGRRQVASVLDNMDVLPDCRELLGFDRGQAAANDNGGGTVPAGLADQVPALRRGGVGHAAGIDDNQLRRVRSIRLRQPEAFQKLANLLTLVVIYFAPESEDGESTQHVV